MSERVRVGVVAPEPEALAEAVREAGGEPVSVPMPQCPGNWGVALVREWVGELLEVELGALGVEALVFRGGSAAEAAGALFAAARLDLPAVHAGPLDDTVFDAAVAALGFTPLGLPAVAGERERGEAAARAALSAVGEKGLVARRLVDSFSLANALRVALSLGAGPETLVHLAALGRAADVVGFPRMARVLTPETPSVATLDSGWYRRVGFGGLLARLGKSLHDGRTVAGALKSFAKVEVEEPEEERYACEFVRARASGAEVLCRLPAGEDALSGICRVASSEGEALRVVEDLLGEPDDEAVFLVVRGCGVGGEPGLRVLGELGTALREAGLSGRVSVLADGLAPDAAVGGWASAFSPEAGSGGVIGRLADGDLFRIDLAEDRMLTSVSTEELSGRRGFRKPSRRERGLASYAERYAKGALPPFEGAGFG